MLLRVDPLAPQPVFEQLVFQVKSAVAKGVLAPGDRLPSVRELAKTVAVNPNTIVRALEALEREGVIVRRQGAGCFIAEPTRDRTVKARRRQLEEMLASVVTEAFHLGFRGDEVRAALDAALATVNLEGDPPRAKSPKERRES
jgi:GntR family transcriptional regulator